MEFDPVRIHKLISSKVYFGIQIAFNKTSTIDFSSKKHFFSFRGLPFRPEDINYPFTAYPSQT